jgi:hypothetical protein
MAGGHSFVSKTTTRWKYQLMCKDYEINLLIIINPIKRFQIVPIFLPLNQKQKIALQRDTDIVQVQSDWECTNILYEKFKSTIK